MFRAVVAALVLFVPTLCWAGEAPRLGQEALLEKMSVADEVVLLDVRTPKEYSEGFIPGAINIPHDELEARIAELDGARGKEIVVYCRSGRRSDIALDLLQKAGFERVYHLEGDYLGWTEAKRPVEK
jgi:phage shock protein E